MKKKAFTLAEVLITLGIIGVVAAMTLPALINNYQAKVLQTGFKKSYSNLSKAVMYTKNSLGVTNLREAFATYDETNAVYPNARIFFDEFEKNIKAIKKVDMYPFKNYSGTQTVTSNEGHDMPVALNILPDGSSMGVWINGSQIRFWVDTNGPKKLPNRYGFDIFEFRIKDKTDKLYTLKAVKNYTEEELEDQRYPWVAGSPCYKSSNQAANGMGCSWYAMNDICPDDETKSYWKNLPK